jgi:hypothetical protein
MGWHSIDTGEPDRPIDERSPIDRGSAAFGAQESVQSAKTHT